MAACNVAKDKAVTSYAVGNEAIARIPFPRRIECTNQKTVSHELAPHWSRFSFRGFAYATPPGTLELHRQKNLPGAAFQFLTSKPGQCRNQNTISASVYAGVLPFGLSRADLHRIYDGVCQKEAH